MLGFLIVFAGCGGVGKRWPNLRIGVAAVGAQPLHPGSASRARHVSPRCTMFVAPAGSSSSSGGSVGSPTTLSAALSAVLPGSVVCLEAGTYATKTNIFLGRSGSSSAPITYRNYGGTALIEYTGTAAAYPTGGVLETGSGANWGGTHDLVIDGLTIDGGNWLGGGISLIPGSHHITIRNLRHSQHRRGRPRAERHRLRHRGAQPDLPRRLQPGLGKWHLALVRRQEPAADIRGPTACLYDTYAGFTTTSSTTSSRAPTTTPRTTATATASSSTGTARSRRR